MAGLGMVPATTSLLRCTKIPSAETNHFRIVAVGFPCLSQLWLSICVAARHGVENRTYHKFPLLLRMVSSLIPVVSIKPWFSSHMRLTDRFQH